MATKACTYNGQAMFNGGWVPSSGYSTTQDAYLGNAKGYGAVRKFTIPAASGSAAGRSITFTLDVLTGYEGSTTIQYWITTAGRPDGSNYGSGPPTIQGTTIVSGEYWIGGLSTSNYKSFTITTPTTSSLPVSGGTYYLWLRATTSVHVVVKAASGTFTLNYTDVTACTAPTSFTSGKEFYGNLNGGDGSVVVSWSGASAGTNNSIAGYKIQGRYPGGDWYDKWEGTGTSATIYFEGLAGQTITIDLRIQTKGSAGASYYSGWKTGSVVALGRTRCTTPTSWSVTPNPFESDLTFTWSGAAAGLNNPISGYEIAYRTSSDNWETLKTFKVIASTATSGSVTYPFACERGVSVAFYIATLCSVGGSYNSSWSSNVTVKRNSPPKSPTSITASKTLVSSGETITLSWSGATDPDNNIWGYGVYKSLDQINWTWLCSSGGVSNTSATVTLSDGAGQTVYIGVTTVDSFSLESGKQVLSVTINADPLAPTSCTVSPEVYTQGESVTVSWAGAADSNNNIAQYRVQTRYTVNGAWQAWTDAAVIASTATGGSYTMTPTLSESGEKLQFRVRTEDSLGAVSGYTESPEILRSDQSSVKVYVDGAWVDGRVFVCSNGAYKEVEIKVCHNGQYVSSG